MVRADLAFVFPGQGSQSVGMLAALAEAHPLVRETFAEASEGAGRDLWALAQNGPEAELGRTENTQPALLAGGVAVWRVWQALGGPQPAQLAGHSLGEYSALVAAGALNLADAAGLVAERGRLMQGAVAEGVGAMAAVLGGEPEQIAAACRDAAGDQVVAPANYNAPGQIVIAGHAEAVERALAGLAAQGVRKAIRLPVSVPSHCWLMREAAERLAERIGDIRMHLPSLPVIQNADARSFDSLDAIRDALARQLYQPVRWIEVTEALRDNGASLIAECGPGKVLTGLARRIDKSLDARSLADPADLSAALDAWKPA